MSHTHRQTTTPVIEAPQPVVHADVDDGQQLLGNHDMVNLGVDDLVEFYDSKPLAQQGPQKREAVQGKADFQQVQGDWNNKQKPFEVQKLSLRGTEYAFKVVAVADQADAEHLTAMEFVGVKQVFKALDAELANLDGSAPTADDKRRGLRLGDFGATPVGQSTQGLKADTAVPQAETCVDRIAKEMVRSKAYRDLCHELVTGKGTPIELLFGKHSCGFFDSYGSNAVDIDDMASLQTANTPLQGDAHLDDGTGLSQGELLMHVLEERYQMHRVQGDGASGYKQAHYHCLSDDSYQTRYRDERGLEGRTVHLDGCHVDADHQHFDTMDSIGNFTRVENVPTSKCNQPMDDYDASRAVVHHDHVDLGSVATDKLEQATMMAAFGAKLDDNTMSEVRHWAGVGQADAKAAVATAEQRTKTLFDRVADEKKALNAIQTNAGKLGGLQDAIAQLERSTNGVDPLALSDVAQAVAEPDGFDASEYADWKDGKIGFPAVLNCNRRYKTYDANLKAAKSPRAKHGAAVQELADKRVALVQAEQKLTTDFALLDQRVGGPLLMPDVAAPYLETGIVKSLQQSQRKGLALWQTHRTDQVLGGAPQSVGSTFLQTQRTARPTGINDATQHAVPDSTKHADRRNCHLTSLGAVTNETASQVATGWQTKKGASVQPGQQTEEMWWRADNDKTATISGNRDLVREHGVDGEAVGDAQWDGLQEAMNDASNGRTVAAHGEPDKDKTMPEADLVAALKLLGDGTQAVVWMTNDAYTAGHYVYAEVYNGQVVFEDHQFARDQGDHDDDRRATVDRFTQGALTDDVGAYTQGCFISVS